MEEPEYIHESVWCAGWFPCRTEGQTIRIVRPKNLFDYDPPETEETLP